jgi:NADH-quinone oxidoreductase subunit J
MGFDFLGFLFLSIYIGAIAIFFLFVVMMINIPIYIRKSNIFKPFLFTILLFVFFFVFDYLISVNIYNAQATLQTYSKISLGVNYLNSTEVIASVFYTQYFIFFLILACILLLSMLGSMLIIDKYKNTK